MKQIARLLALLLVPLLIVGCDSASPDVSGPSPSSVEQNAVQLSATLLDVLGDGHFMAVDEKGNRFTVGGADVPLTDADGKEVSSSAFAAGQTVVISYDGMMAESFPAQIIHCYGIARGDSGKDADVEQVEAYLAVADDIFQEDEGLNSGIQYLVADTTPLTGLTTAERELFRYRMEKEHESLTVMDSTREELAESGYIQGEPSEFSKGVLIEFSNPAYDAEGRTLTCGILKWRSGRGAVGSDEVKAVYSEEGWSVTKENLFMS